MRTYIVGITRKVIFEKYTTPVKNEDEQSEKEIEYATWSKAHFDECIKRFYPGRKRARGCIIVELEVPDFILFYDFFLKKDLFFYYGDVLDLISDFPDETEKVHRCLLEYYSKGKTIILRSTDKGCGKGGNEAVEHLYQFGLRYN